MPKAAETKRKSAKAADKGGKRKKGLPISPTNRTHLADCLADPNAPKRSLSAYMIFANEQRDKVREDNPGIKFG